MKKWLLPIIIGIVNTIAFSVVVPLVGTNTFVNVFTYVILGAITVTLYYLVKFENFLYVLISLPISLILGFLLNNISLGFNPEFNYLVDFLVKIIIVTIVEVAILDGCDQLFNNKNRFGVAGTPWKKK